jgi:hypothetical protein
MLYQQLPRMDSIRQAPWERWLVPAVISGAAATVAILLLLIGQILFAGAAIFAGLAAAVVTYRRALSDYQPIEPLVAGPDYALVGAALALSREPTALTSNEGSLLIVNPAYRERFGGTRPPLELGNDEQAHEGLQLAQSMAWRDGAGCVAGIVTISGASPVEVERIGSHADLLLWRFPDPSPIDPLTNAVKGMQGLTGERLAAAGVMAVVVDSKGGCSRPTGRFRNERCDLAKSLPRSNSASWWTSVRISTCGWLPTAKRRLRCASFISPRTPTGTAAMGPFS